MASTINAQTTPFAAIVQEADSTGNLAFQTANVTALTITTAQNVGIGTSSPSTKLHVSGVITATGGVTGTPAFSAYQSSGQSLGAGINTKITFTTEDFDTASAYDTGTSRFTPQVAGYYQFNCAVRADVAVNALHVKLAHSTIGEFAGGTFTNTALSSFQSSCSGLVYMNGSTDFVEVFAFSGLALTLTTGRGPTYFQGVLVRAA